MEAAKCRCNPSHGENQTTSEMGHLFYSELGLSAGSTTTAQLNALEFNNLLASWYWFGTENAADPNYAWVFAMDYGNQPAYLKSGSNYGLAVRNVQVSAVPVPGAIWLFGSGLTSLAVLSRRRKGNRI